MKRRRTKRCGAFTAVAMALTATFPAMTMTTVLSFEERSSPTTHQPWMSNTQSITPKTSWWAPSMGYTSAHVDEERRSGVTPGTSFDFFPPSNENHQEELSIPPRSDAAAPSLPNDPVAAMQLRNAIHQAACDALIYQGRWRYCVAVWDERLLEWMQGAACPGNFWTPKTYLVVAAQGNMDMHVDDHSIWQHWEGSRRLELSSTADDPARATAAAADNVKKLRSLASRILPRLSNSGHKSTDIPVFDTMVIPSCRLQRLLHQVAAAAAAAEDSRASESRANQHHGKHKRPKKKKQKNQDVPWIVPVMSSDRTLLLPSLKVLQAAKQLLVVQTTEDIEFHETHMGGPLQELFPNALWLETIIRMPPPRSCR
jgi:hypothetical protein